MVENNGRDRRGRFGWLLVAAVLWATGPATAQPPVVISGPQGQPMTPEQAKAMAEAQQRAAQAGAQPGGQPPAEAKPDEKKKEGEGDDKKKEEAPDSVKRPEKPPRVPDPRELEVKLDEQGRVSPFNFIGQPWPDVLQWLANVSKCSLDWQELPNDYLNLTTQRSYTVDEVRDLINRHLHARGYTSIQAGEVLSIFKIDKLDPSLVRRVTEEDLYDLKLYDYVKVSFELPASMEVEKAKEEVKQVLSPHAKVFPLATTKRLLLLDSVANLRTVSELLNQERIVQDGRILPKEFVLKHARPEQVIDILYVVLGMDPKSRPTQMDLQLQQQKLQLMTQMQQQGKDVTSMLKKDGPPVFLAYNRQRNSVIANAPPAEMKIIERTIAYLDVPFGAEGAFEVGAAAVGERKMERYPLTTLDPDNFVVTLEEIGGLSPSAEFKVDKQSKILFALATATDHEKINSLIDQFDGTGRQFEVIWLRRLPADAVAATIYKLMAGQTEEEDENRGRRYWSPWDYPQRDEEKAKPIKGFGVDADIENNRLLLWANEEEMERVRDLLIKLGEIPTGEADQRRVRFIQPGGEAPPVELLERLRDAWSATGNNELIIKVPPDVKSAAPADTVEKKKDADKDEAAEPAADRSTGAQQPSAIVAQYVQLAGATSEDSGDAPVAESSEAGEPAVPEEKAAGLPPLTITVTEDGRLMLSSPDTAALDRMEALIEQLTPLEKRYRVYRLKYISALNMKWNLEDFFKEDLEEGSGGYVRDWYGFMMPKGSQDKGGVGLSKRRKLMISWDTSSNTILVANASPSQLQEVEQLIAEYDRPPAADSARTRRTAAIKVQYSKASVIADAIKEVYRDLLSSRDKEFERGNQRDRGATEERVTIFRYGSDSSDSSDQRPSPVKVGFEGALSIGVDDVANMIIVSVQEELFDNVVMMIHQLDEEAAPKTTVQVHRVNGNVKAEALQKAIEKALGKPWPGGRPEQQTGQTADNRNQRDDGERGQGDRRGGGNNN